MTTYTKTAQDTAPKYVIINLFGQNFAAVYDEESDTYNIIDGYSRISIIENREAICQNHKRVKTPDYESNQV